MKKHIPTPDPAKRPGGPSSPKPVPDSAPVQIEPAPVRILWRTTELFACLLTVLLPIKFASFVSAPEGGALYWSDPLSLVFIAWPLPVFMMASPILLGLTLAAAVSRRDMPLCPPLVRYAALWCILGGESALGLVNASCMGYPPQMIAHTLSLA